MTKPTKSFLIAGAAALAIAVSPATFAQGQGNGNGKGKDNGPPAAAAKGDRGNGGGNRGNGNANRGNAAPPMMRGNDKGNDKGNGGGNRGGPAIVAPKFNGNGNGKGNPNRGGPPVKIGKDNAGRGSDRGNGNDLIRVRNRDGIDINVGFALPDLRRTLYRDDRLIQGCPPGLAKKRNGCLPPGQAKKLYRPYDGRFFGFGSGPYYYNDGFLLSYSGGRLSGYIPLLGGALTIGNPWPSYYAPAPLPGYYESYYGLGEPRSYRFADNVIYRVDPETAAIASVAALLTGSDIVIGQPMPRGYDVYNVPYSYRDRYYDRPDRRYRYSDGYIYEIDPKTALVVAAIDLVS